MATILLDIYLRPTQKSLASCVNVCYPNVNAFSPLEHLTLLLFHTRTGNISIGGNKERNEVSQVAQGRGEQFNFYATSDATMVEATIFNSFDEVGTECIQGNDIPQSSLLAAHFLLQLKEQHHTTQAAINFTVKSIQDIIKLLQQSSSIPNDNDDGCSIFDPFHQLNTEYQQIKFYKQHFGLIITVDLVYNNFFALGTTYNRTWKAL